MPNYHPVRFTARAMQVPLCRVVPRSCRTHNYDHAPRAGQLQMETPREVLRVAVAHAVERGPDAGRSRRDTIDERETYKVVWA